MVVKISKTSNHCWLFLFLGILVLWLAPACSQPGASITATPAPSYEAARTQADTLSGHNLQPLEYYSPLQGAQYISIFDTLILRYGPALSLDDLDGIDIHLQGSLSGTHTGSTTLADDQRTVIFEPDEPFSPGEQVEVRVGSLSLNSGAAYQPLEYTFTVALNQQPGEVASTAVPTSTIQSAYPFYLTLPQDIPHYTVYTTTSTLSDEGYIFVAPFFWTKSTLGSYLLILDNDGQIVYYQSVADQLSAFDFKVLPDGNMAFYNQKAASHVIMDSHYHLVDTYLAQNGYSADLHDFVMTPDGYVLLMAYDMETIDMSQVVPGGNSNAAVTGLVIQELDPSQNVIFQWRSWDHFAFTDSTSSLTDQQIDLVHGNGLALTADGNLLLSSRNLSEITKINLNTGEIMWRLGGKNSTFRFINDGGFHYQHNISVLPNGNITIFDNHGTDKAPTPSRAVEYRLDLADKTATLVWEFTHKPPIFTDFMGNVERMPNGNTFIGWGNAGTVPEGYVFSSITEVTPENQVVFELAFDEPFVSYRAFREAWVGEPDTAPALAFSQGIGGLTLGYSWNGSTKVASWKLYGGNSPGNLTLLDQRTKTGFETQSYLRQLPFGECYFQVAALDVNGNELARSATITTDVTACPVSQ